MGSASDFEALILYPEIARNRSNSACRIGRVIWGRVKVRIISSAKRVILNSLSLTAIPHIYRLFRMEAARGSTHNANNKGDSGHPCLVPFVIVKDVESAKGS